MTGVNDFDPARYLFRGLNPSLHLGTASDRYAGWIGQIYSEDRYLGQIIKRTNKVGGKSFKEHVLPVSSVEEYFQHFRILEIDYTFYSPLLTEKGEATRTFHVLKAYRDHLKSNDYLFLKVPQVIFAQKLRHGSGYIENHQFLDVRAFVDCFYQPAKELLGGNLKGFIFEQEYQRRAESCSAQDLAGSLDEFFGSLPADDRYHVELRTDRYLSAPIFETLRKHGIGQVLSHWTWLPPLSRQFKKSGQRFIDAGNQVVIRLMTPIGMRYEAAYAKAHPFNKLLRDMLQPSMVADTADLMGKGLEQNIEVNVLINNRAGGNAPQIAQLVSMEFLTREGQRTKS